MTSRLFPLTGVAFFALFLASFALGSGGDTASTHSAVSYYVAHQSQIRVSLSLMMIGVVALLFFAPFLCNVLRGTGDGNQPLAGAVLAGGAMWGAGLLILAVTQDAFLHAAVNGQAGAATALNVLDSNDFYPMIGGMAITLLAAGIATVRGAALPAWLGWIAILIGLLALAGPLGMIAFFAAPFWILIAAVVLTARGVPTETAAMGGAAERRGSPSGVAAS